MNISTTTRICLNPNYTCYECARIFDNCMHTEILDLSHNTLINLHKSLIYIIQKIKELKEINLKFNKLTSFLPLTKITNLTTLRLGCNYIQHIPPQINKLTNLTMLGLEYNKITKLSPNIFDLCNLEILKLEHNSLKSIPSNIKKLKKLKYLSVFDNILTWISPDIGSLNKLEELDLQHNNLKTISPLIGQLVDCGIFLNDNKLDSHITSGHLKFFYKVTLTFTCGLLYISHNKSNIKLHFVDCYLFDRNVVKIIFNLLI